MEVDEGIVTRSVLIAEGNRGGGSFSGLGEVGGVEGGMSAGGGFASGIVAHIAHIGTPRFACGVELIGKSLDGGWIDAAGADGLAIRGDAGESKILIDLAIITCLRSGGLAAEHGDIVVEADVAGAVILVEEHALGGKSFGEVRSLGIWTEGDVVAFVFEDDDEHVFDLVAEVVVAGLRTCGSEQ